MAEPKNPAPVLKRTRKTPTPSGKDPVVPERPTPTKYDRDRERPRNRKGRAAAPNS